MYYHLSMMTLVFKKNIFFWYIFSLFATYFVAVRHLRPTDSQYLSILGVKACFCTSNLLLFDGFTHPAKLSSSYIIEDGSVIVFPLMVVIPEQLAML